MSILNVNTSVIVLTDYLLISCTFVNNPFAVAVVISVAVIAPPSPAAPPL